MWQITKPADAPIAISFFEPAITLWDPAKPEHKEKKEATEREIKRLAAKNGAPELIVLLDEMYRSAEPLSAWAEKHQTPMLASLSGLIFDAVIKPISEWMREFKDELLNS